MPALFPACCHCHALPAEPLPASLLPAVPGLRPSDALCAGRRDIPVLAWPARPPSPALYMCGCVCVGCCNVPVPVDVFLVCILPFLITRATGTLDDTSTSSDGGGEILEKAIRRSVLSQAVQVETSCAGGVETSCAVEVQATS